MSRRKLQQINDDLDATDLMETEEVGSLELIHQVGTPFTPQIVAPRRSHQDYAVVDEKITDDESMADAHRSRGFLAF
ncbi:hypothetical protein MMC07_007888 [Pseudocyphellaria aurata]|nr:hypothetical protein [Pseudocyphellaria aurata]